MALPSTYSAVRLQNVHKKKGDGNPTTDTEKDREWFDIRPVQEATFPERNLIWLYVNEAGSGGGWVEVRKGKPFLL